MIAKTNTCSLQGIEAILVEAEVDLASGLPDNIVKESRDRIKAAIQNSGYPFPFEKITVNLAPAAVKKEGAGFDLPIEIGILPADNAREASVPMEVGGRKREEGICAFSSRSSELISPSSSACPPFSARPANHLCEVVEYLNGRSELSVFNTCPDSSWSAEVADELDFEDVKGQLHAKRSLQVAAAGNHNVLTLYGISTLESQGSAPRLAFMSALF